MNRPLIMHAEPVAMCCSSFLHPWLPKLSDMCTTSPAGMLETKVPKFSWSSGEADQEIPTEVWSTVIVATLSLAEIVGMRAVSKAFCVHMTDDDLWMNKMTSLVLRYPVLMHVHQRMGERMNVPADVYPITVMMDAGGGITKVVLKHTCITRADSVRCLTLLGILIGVKDTYTALHAAFGPIYAAISRMNEEHMYVDLPWAPRLPITGKWELRGDAKLPTCLESHCTPSLMLNL